MRNTEVSEYKTFFFYLNRIFCQSCRLAPCKNEDNHEPGERVKHLHIIMQSSEAFGIFGAHFVVVEMGALTSTCILVQRYGTMS